MTMTVSKHTKVQAAFGRVVLVTNFNDDMYSETTVGTLRNALANAQDGDIIRFSGVTPGTSTVALYDALPGISKGMIIEGNGLTLTRSASMTVNASSELLHINEAAVYISRIHFKDGWAENGAAIRVFGKSLALDSCIFSGNRSGADAGAIDIEGGALVNIKSCTFYDNKGGWLAAITNVYSGSLTLMGNLFFDNDAVVGSFISGGYNVFDSFDYRSAIWEAAPTDTTFSDLGITDTPINTTTFTPVSGLNSIIPNPPPQGFPVTDFYGNTRTFPGAPGAVK
jgi:hypothetical protein